MLYKRQIPGWYLVRTQLTQFTNSHAVLQIIMLSTERRCNKRQLELMRQKIVHVDAQIRELTIRAYKLQNCLDNGCDDCYPGSGNRYNIWSKTTSQPPTEVKYKSPPDEVILWFAVSSCRGQQIVSLPKKEIWNHDMKDWCASSSAFAEDRPHKSLYCYLDLSLTLYNMDTWEYNIILHVIDVGWQT